MLQDTSNMPTSKERLWLPHARTRTRTHTLPKKTVKNTTDAYAVHTTDPVASSSRMLASTIGKPVVPVFHALMKLKVERGVVDARVKARQ
jgi:hypothetical protein